MVRRQQALTWPFLVVLVCLFALCAMAPRAWQRSARRQNASATISDAAERRAAEASALALTEQAEKQTEKAAPVTASSEPVAEPVHTSGWLSAAPAEKVAHQPIEDSTESLFDILEIADDREETVHVLDGPPKDESIERLPEIDVASLPKRPEQPSLAPFEPALEKSREPLVVDSASSWRSPRALLENLDELATVAETSAWATETQRQIQQLGEAVQADQEDLEPLCARLDATARQADKLATRLKPWALASQLRRVNYALRRRIDVWRGLLASDGAQLAAAEPDAANLALALGQIDELTADHAEGRAWRSYLLLDALDPPSDTTSDDAHARELARRILGRLAQTPLDEHQREFLKAEPFQALGRELRRMAAAPIDPAQMLDAVECYEESRLPSDARRLADECMWLAILPTDARQAVAQRMTNHYRNANLRIVLTADLLNRMLPPRPAEYEMIHDVVLGNPVHGQSMAETRLSIQLIPDPSRLLLALQISGEVAALTSSTSGPATFHNASQSVYVARKPMEITMRGIRLWPAEVERVNNATRLRGVKTDLDAIPLIGPLVQGVARSQHESNQPDIQREVEMKTAMRAKTRIDDEADARLADVSARLRQRVFEPVESLALGPTLIDAKTTDQRLTMRLRLASRRQLGAHTPRPMAPTDSLASFQVHQTAMNNFVERLELDGGTFTVVQLRERIADRLGRPELMQHEGTHDDDIEITFAPENAVCVTCDDGRIGITLSIARLCKSPRSWDDFQVRAYYRPEVEGLSVELVRDGVVQLVGRRVRTSSQVELRTIFSRVFSKRQSRQLIPDRIRENPGLADVAVNQMVIDDGWIGLALGQKRADHVARRP